MKALLLSICLLWFTLPVFAYRSYHPHGGTVHVRSTVTRRGTYRPAHFRAAPNHTQRDNWSAKGNVNPYTGKAGTKRAKR